MRLENYTNISESEIRKIILFVKPNNLLTSRFDVKVTNSRYESCGVFYQYGGYSKRANAMGSKGRPLIIARISRDEDEFPYWSDHRPPRIVTFHYDKYNSKNSKWESWHISKHIGSKNGNSGGYLDSIILSREEALVHNLAYEFRHFWQTNHIGKRGKVWRARKGPSSERDADAYAIRKQREWRTLHNPQDAMQIRKINWELVEKDVVTVKDAAGVSIPINHPIRSAINKDVFSDYGCGTDINFGDANRTGTIIVIKDDNDALTQQIE